MSVKMKGFRMEESTIKMLKVLQDYENQKARELLGEDMPSSYSESYVVEKLIRAKYNELQNKPS